MTPSDDGRPGGARSKIDPRIRQRRVAIRRGAGRRRLRWVIAALVVIVVAVVAELVLHTSTFSSRMVEVTGSHPHTPTLRIVSVAGLDHPVPLIDVDPGAVAARVEALPYIASAAVSLRWPDKVVIAVKERSAVAVLSGPGSRWSVLSATGRVLMVDSTRPADLPQLVITGASGPLVPGSVGTSLAATADPGLAVCSTLPVAFSAQVVTVSAAVNGTVTLALNSGLSVALGTATQLPAKYEDVASIISHVSLKGKKVIDVTVPGAPVVG